MFTRFQNYVSKSVGTSPTTVFTCPAGQSFVINQLSCANITTVNVNVIVSVVRSSTEVFILRNATVPAGGSLICAGEDQKITIMAGDSVRVTSNTASSIDVLVSGVLNDFNPSVAVPAVVVGTNATISVAASSTTISENQTVTFTVTTNLPNGTVIYWENIGTVNAQDFTDDQGQGTALVSGGTASFTRTLRTSSTADSIGEGNETIIMAVGITPRYLGGGVLATSPTVTVFDTPVTNGLIVWLDSGNSQSYSGSGTFWTDIAGGRLFQLFNSPTFSNGTFTFNGTNQYAATTDVLNLTSFEAITVEILVRTTATAGTYIAFEHTNNWNTNAGGLGLAMHSSGVAGQTNSMHTNHNTSVARNYLAPVGTDWALHTNIYSRIASPTGRLSYVNGTLVPFDAGTAGYGTSTATPGGSFANSNVFLASRGGTAAFMPGAIRVFRIYNRALSAAEVQQNYLSLQGRIGPTLVELSGANWEIGLAGPNYIVQVTCPNNTGAPYTTLAAVTVGTTLILRGSPIGDITVVVQQAPTTLSLLNRVNFGNVTGYAGVNRTGSVIVISQL